MAESARQQTTAPPISLTEALAAIDRIEPVAATVVELVRAAGLTLAGDAILGSTKLRLAGARLRRIDIAQLTGAGIADVAVRVPRLLIVTGGAGESTRAMIKGAIEGEGGVVAEVTTETALAKDDFDAAIAFADQETTHALQPTTFDGVALSPGGGISFGHAGGRPFLVLPARFNEALAAWLAIGRRFFARLAFRLIEEQPYLLELARPIPSTRGLAEIIAVRRRAAQVEPLLGDWTAESIARADGWILMPAESDGFAAGTRVQMRPWP